MKLKLLVFLLTVLPAALCGEGANASRVIQFRGPIRYISPELYGSSVELRFELYRSPERGLPIWTETRKVLVSTNGWVRADLGTVSPLPDEAFRSSFRFLSIWHGTTECGPRKQVVSVAYAVPQDSAQTGPLASSSASSNTQAPIENGLSTLTNFGEFGIEQDARKPLTWLDAQAAAQRLGAALPTFEEWYEAVDSGDPNIGRMHGHYEWVVPWVYDPAVHSRMNELYRGKPIACYYEEISPNQLYSYRLVKRAE